jgi:hypothetical protein
MADCAEVPTLEDEPIGVDEVIAQLKLTGAYRAALLDLNERRRLRRHFAALGLVLDRVEVEERALAARFASGLEDAAAFSRHLEALGVSAGQWLETIRADAIRDGLKRHLATPERIAAFHLQDPLRFASIEIARIACRDQGQACRVLTGARGRRSDFAVLARRFSVDDSTRLAGGWLGAVSRGVLPPEVERQALEGGEGKVIGPFCEETLWTVYKVYALNIPKLTDALKAVIAEAVFADWLKEQELRPASEASR